MRPFFKRAMNKSLIKKNNVMQATKTFDVKFVKKSERNLE